MNRTKLLGISAMLNVAQAELTGAGHDEAANKVSAAVVDLHRDAGWTVEELKRMGEVQKWIIEQLVEDA